MTDEQYPQEIIDMVRRCIPEKVAADICAVDPTSIEFGNGGCGHWRQEVVGDRKSLEGETSIGTSGFDVWIVKKS